MRMVLCGVVLSMLTFVGPSAAQGKNVIIEGTIIEIGPSPYATKGGIGRILIKTDRDRIVFHIMKDTKIIQMVDGKPVEAKFADLAKDSKVRATFDGRVMESRPPQAWTIQLEILKPAK